MVAKTEFHRVSRAFYRKELQIADTSTVNEHTRSTRSKTTERERERERDQ
jgi:hypothetical protein